MPAATVEEVTLADTAHKTYATIPLAQFGDKIAGAMPQVPADQQEALKNVMVSVKSKVDSKATGRSDTIQGVEAEEREITLSIEIPMPAGAPIPAVTMKMVMQIWTAKPQEAMHLPAIRELAANNFYAKYFMNPADTFKKMTGQMPMIPDMGSLFEELSKNSAVVLRMHMDMYMPSAAAAAAQMAQQQGKPMAGFDPDAPMMRVNQEVVELSAAAVDDSIFQLPKDLAAAPVEDVLKGMLQARP